MIGNDWDDVLKIVWDSNGFKTFYDIIEKMYETKTIYPKKENIFNALKSTPYHNVKVVIMGQDPYPGDNQAHGLSFSVQDGVAIPKSLQNIFLELKNDCNIEPSSSGELSGWAEQGVLLLNSVLTVEKNKSESHKGLGWERLTDYIIKVLNLKEEPVVFILWGADAIKKSALITNQKHLILSSSHPSPLSAYRTFFGSKPFSKANEFLVKNNISPINWSYNLKSSMISSCMSLPSK